MILQDLFNIISLFLLFVHFGTYILSLFHFLKFQVKVLSFWLIFKDFYWKVNNKPNKIGIWILQQKISLKISRKLGMIVSASLVMRKLVWTAHEIMIMISLTIYLKICSYWITSNTHPMAKLMIHSVHKNLWNKFT